MWAKFIDLWHKSIYFRGAVVVFVVGMILALQGGGGGGAATK